MLLKNECMLSKASMDFRINVKIKNKKSNTVG